MNAIFLEEKRFKCQQSGHCCCDREIVVTLTCHDIFRLYSALENNFELLIQKLSFYKMNDSVQKDLLRQLVLSPIQTSQGNVIPGIRKREDSSCIFYFPPNCSIYADRPLACRNYPLAFVKEKKDISCVWAKKSLKSCPGIGKGAHIDPLNIRKLGNEYFRDIKSHNYVVGEINKEATEGKMLTTRESIWILIAYSEKENR